jgi:hypothetical protein
VVLRVGDHASVSHCLPVADPSVSDGDRRLAR